ncbi:MAG: hypothetical protein KI791_19010 [Cyclobacteriaceae bacterium]|nr:hypothetical protein [Cyclobacteriaceae bacterium SS2]
MAVVLATQACSTTSSGDQGFQGNWKAIWETDPAGYPGLSDKLDFTMGGRFLIEGDSITIEGYGYKGCIFTEDTIHHKLIWKIRNDSLMLYNDAQTPGLTYRIIQSGEGQIKLQLEDIFVTLTK